MILRFFFDMVNFMISENKKIRYALIFLPYPGHGKGYSNFSTIPIRKYTFDKWFI